MNEPLGRPTGRIAEILSSERRAPAPPAAVQDRVLARAAAQSAEPAPTAGGSGPSSTLPVSAKTAALVVAAAIAGVVAYSLFFPEPRRARAPAPAASAPSAPETAAPSAPAVSPAPAPVAPVAEPSPIELPSPPVHVVAKRAPASAAPAADADDLLRREQLLLEEARSALAGGNPGAAVQTLERHRAEFPSGQLVEEREALAVRALARAGRNAEAEARAARFLEAHPRSIFRPAVESALQR